MAEEIGRKEMVLGWGIVLGLRTREYDPCHGGKGKGSAKDFSAGVA